jgi:hypothetical protein
MDVDIYDYAGFDGSWGSRPLPHNLEHELSRKNQDLLLTETLKVRFETLFLSIVKICNMLSLAAPNFNLDLHR